MLNVAKEEAADIVLCGAIIATAEDRAQGAKVEFPSREVIQEDILQRFCRLELGSGVIWNKLYRSDIVRAHSLREFERRVDSGADYIVNFGCFASAKRVVTVPDAFYFYFHRHDSMSRAPSKGAKFAVVLRAYVVCLEVHASDRSYYKSIDDLYARQLRHDAYRIEAVQELDLVREDLTKHEAFGASARQGAYALVHVFDPERNRTPIGVQRALRDLISAAKQLPRSIVHRLTR